MVGKNGIGTEQGQGDDEMEDLRRNTTVLRKKQEPRKDQEQELEQGQDQEQEHEQGQEHMSQSEENHILAGEKQGQFLETRTWTLI